MPLKTTARDGALVVDVLVKPRSSRERIGPVIEPEGRLQLSVTAPPVDGEANSAVVALLSRALGVPRRSVTILRGETGRKKTVRIAGASMATLLAAIEEAGETP